MAERKTFEVTVKLYLEGDRVGIDLGFDYPDKNYDPAFLAAVYALRSEILTRREKWLENAAIITFEAMERAPAEKTFWMHINPQAAMGKLSHPAI
ncbi:MULTISPECIES: hypothetical protein [unclassified Providencia]|uniref:hypothetical protein n=1 Tax=unclassified Providencia TaxID=2633465 RepID=UPI00234A4C4B|nr:MULTISPECIES: hypothetical protein [unclassified Providencia]